MGKNSINFEMGHLVPNEPISIGSNFHENVKTFQYPGSLFTRHNFVHRKEDVDLKQEINVTI